MKTKIKFFVIVFFIIPFSIYSQGWNFQNITAGSNILYGVHALNPRTCIIAGGYIQDLATNIYTVFRTTNGGINWTAISSGSGYYFTCVQFLDSLNGYAGGGAHFIMPEEEYGKCIYKTTNGGANWNSVFSFLVQGSSLMDTRDIHFFNILTGWACGLDGSIAKTTNGGVNFMFYATPTSYKKNSIFFINDMTGWVCGENGNISKSTSGGTNWFTQPLTSTININSVYFKDQNTGYVCGNNGMIYKTINGGTNWSACNSGTTINLNSVFFYNVNTGWAAGTNIVLASTNGGANWSPQFTGVAGLSSVYFCDSVNGWSCGGNKVIASKSGGWTGVNNSCSEIPSGCRLFQNYPNPFNSMTNIKYEISIKEYRSLNLEVRIVLYDVPGKEVKILVNENKTAGVYETGFTGENFHSGIYYYSLFINGKRTDTKKLVLLK
jgi:photosystem II stability/assembly factor-like uncharacterized protein